VAHIDANGLVLGNGKLKGQLDIDPFAPKQTFDMAAEMTYIDLPILNNFLRAYGKFDVAEGFFSVFMECTASAGKFNGYVKPLLEKLKVVNWKADKKNPAKLLWESIVGAVTGVFKNKKEDRLATSGISNRTTRRDSSAHIQASAMFQESARMVVAMEMPLARGESSLSCRGGVDTLRLV
jgi:hypothetical protein